MSKLLNNDPIKKSAINTPVSFKRRFRRILRKIFKKKSGKLIIGGLGAILIVFILNYFIHIKDESENISTNNNINNTANIEKIEIKPDLQSQKAIDGPAGTLISAQTLIGSTKQGVRIIKNQLNCGKFKISPTILLKTKEKLWGKAYDNESVYFDLKESQKTGIYILTGKSPSSEARVSALDLEEAWCILGEGNAQNLQIFMANMSAAKTINDKEKLKKIWETNYFMHENNKYH